MAVTINVRPEVTVLGQPVSRINMAYNEYVFGFGFTSIPSTATSLKVEVQVLTAAGVLVDTIEVYEDVVYAGQFIPLHNSAHVNVSGVVRSMITDLSAMTGTLYNDTSLHVLFKLKYREVYWYNGSKVEGSWIADAEVYTAVRGVEQIGSFSNLNGNTPYKVVYCADDPSMYAGLLTMFDYSIPCWTGYQRDVSFIVNTGSAAMTFSRLPTGATTAIAATTAPKLYRCLIDPGVVYNDASIRLLGVKAGEICCRQYTIDQRTAGMNPFYVRWINPRGGFDYWMFEKRQILNKVSSDNKLVGRNISTLNAARGSHKVYSRNGASTIQAGAVSLSETEYNALATIQYSPRVEYLSGTNWMEIIPDNGDHQLINDKPCGEIEYIFALPQTLMSY